MAGIYIHIPFCKHRCYYCDFYSSVKTSQKDAFISALLNEFELRKNEIKSSEISTIYFGGGTPSILSPNDINLITDTISSNFTYDNNIEITLEANPEDLTPAYISRLKHTPINRVSIGIQSFNKEDLIFLNRFHPVEQTKDNILNLQKAGYQNISIDLIYGFSGLSEKKWENNLLEFLSLKLPHLSAYHLTYEERTVLGHQIKTNKIQPLSEEDSLFHYNLLCKVLAKNGYSHYEISNFALPGYESKHNKLYWENEPYLGLGPAAHSYDRNIRRWNQANLFLYIKQLNNRTLPPYETEILSPTDKYNDYIITRIRTKSGININDIKENFPEKLNYLTGKINILKRNRRLFSFDGKQFKLTEQGYLISNKVMEDLIFND